MATEGLSLPGSFLASALAHALLFGGLALVFRGLAPTPRLAVEVEWVGAVAAPMRRVQAPKKISLAPKPSFNITQDISSEESAASAEQDQEDSPAGSPGGPVSAARVTRMPRRLIEVKARYPDEARKLGVEGKVVLLLSIDEKGRVTDARVLEKAGYGFDEEAVAASKRFVFSPASLGDRPVAMEIRYTYVFELR